MRWIEALLIAAFERNVGSDECATFEDEDLIGAHVYVEDPPARRGTL